jgi:hypothetical protein
MIYINDKNEVLERRETSIGSAFVSTRIKAIPIAQRAYINFQKKMPLAMWRQMIGFFLWSQKEHKSEAQVTGFIHQDTGEWFMIPFHQIGIGMTTKEVEGGDNISLWEQIIQAGFGPNPIFTGHHHCTSSAFASGTDTTDEYTNKPQGVHITIGKLDSNPLDLHCRAKLSFMGQFNQETGEVISPGSSILLPSHPLEFVETGLRNEDVGGMNDVLIKQITEFFLLKKEEWEFPEEWKARMTKQSYATHSTVTYTPGGHLSWKDSKKRPKSRCPANTKYPLVLVNSVVNICANPLNTTAWFDAVREAVTKKEPEKLENFFNEMCDRCGYAKPNKEWCWAWLEAWEIADLLLNCKSGTDYVFDNLPGEYYDALLVSVVVAMYESDINAEAFRAYFTNNKALENTGNDPAFKECGIHTLNIGKKPNTGIWNLYQKMYDKASNEFIDRHSTVNKEAQTIFEAKFKEMGVPKEELVFDAGEDPESEFYGYSAEEIAQMEGYGLTFPDYQGSSSYAGRIL